MNTAKEDFEAALARLVANEPTHELLIDRASKGELKITISSVAMEAGRSRTLIGHKNCSLPEVRKQILEIMENGPDSAQARRALSKVSRRLKVLEKQLAERDTIQTALVLEVSKLRTELANAGPRIVKGSGRSEM